MPNNYKTKVCALCGKSQSDHWARHWKNQHPSSDIRELIPGEEPVQPFDENWLYLIKPLSLGEIYESAAKN
jgi:predicted alpha/beta hydrolase family esterase